jgi:hypothetical protein
LRAVFLQWNDPKHTRNHRFRLIGNQDLSMFFNALQVYGRKLAKIPPRWARPEFMNCVFRFNGTPRMIKVLSGVMR